MAAIDGLEDGVPEGSCEADGMGEGLEVEGAGDGFGVVGCDVGVMLGRGVGLPGL